LRCPDPSAFERAQYMRAVKGYEYVQRPAHMVVRTVEDWGPE
jgi:hypothetical protein